MVAVRPDDGPGTPHILAQSPPKKTGPAGVGDPCLRAGCGVWLPSCHPLTHPSRWEAPIPAPTLILFPRKALLPTEAFPGDSVSGTGCPGHAPALCQPLGSCHISPEWSGGDHGAWGQQLWQGWYYHASLAASSQLAARGRSPLAHPGPGSTRSGAKAALGGFVALGGCECTTCLLLLQ